MDTATGVAPVREESSNGAPTAPYQEEKRPGTEGVDRIREILFGAQMREQQQQVGRLEQRIAQELAEIRDEFRRRLDALENHVKEEIGALAERLAAERGERCERDDALARDIAEVAGSFSRRLHQLEEQMAKSNREMRQQLHDEAASLTAETRRRSEESRSLLETQYSRLRNDMIARAALGDLLAEVALRLKGEFHLPAEVLGNDAARGD